MVFAQINLPLEQAGTLTVEFQFLIALRLNRSIYCNILGAPGFDERTEDERICKKG